MNKETRAIVKKVQETADKEKRQVRWVQPKNVGKLLLADWEDCKGRTSKRPNALILMMSPAPKKKQPAPKVTVKKQESLRK